MVYINNYIKLNVLNDKLQMVWLLLVFEFFFYLSHNFI